MTTDAQRGYQFASDNTSGICPSAWLALEAANAHTSAPYGDDGWTEKLANRLRDWFETDCDIYVTFTGTAANSLALASVCRSYHSVICSDVAHIETDECGAPGFFSHGTTLMTAAARAGKIEPDAIAGIVLRRDDIHYPKPKVLSITQATEMGTVYSRHELEQLGECKRRYGLKWHMDGARFANALVSLPAAPKAITWEVGVDVLCLGGTKNGLAAGDIVVFFQRELSQEFAYRCKQAGQLASKMQFMSAPWLGLLEANAWETNARHANACARQLADAFAAIPGLRLPYPTQANAVFVEMPSHWIESLRRLGWRFYTFIGSGLARFMCSWSTRPEDISLLRQDLQHLSLQSPMHVSAVHANGSTASPLHRDR